MSLVEVVLHPSGVKEYRFNDGSSVLQGQRKKGKTDIIMELMASVRARQTPSQKQYAWFINK